MAHHHGDNGVGARHPYNSFTQGIHGSQLAIFYGGSIHVFDSITPEKAQAIMLIATAASSAAAAERSQAPPPAPPQMAVPSGGEALCRLHGELPLERRKSLQRFLEKRRERCLNMTMAPYSSVTKPQQTAPESGSETSTTLNSADNSVCS